MKGYLKARPALCWALYDWGCTAFATTVLAGFFPTFFRQFWSLGADPTETTFRLGLANGAAGLAIALLAPVLGAIADRGGHRKQFLLGWALLGIGATTGLFFVGQGQWGLAAVLFALGTLGFNGGLVFSDSMLLDVAEARDFDRVSALGYALGYLGGGLLFTLNLLMVVKPAWFGLAGAAEAVRWSFLTVALWWFVFALPLAFFVKDRGGGLRVGALAAVGEGLRTLRGTMRSVRAYRGMFLFLLAYWLYIDGVNTIIKMAIDYGMALGFDSKALLGALLLVQFVAFPAALVFGRLGERFGPRRAVLGGLVVYTGISIWAYFLDSVVEFFALAVVVGLVQGGVQSLSRSFFGRLVPREKAAEFFGFYNMVGKFGTVIGPLLVGFVALLTGSSRGSILSVAVLFIAGGLLLWRVQDPPPAGQSQAEASQP